MKSEILSPRALRTRQALLEAGLELLADRPIDAIAIDDLVARAGVAKGSFFNHFEDKHAFGRAVAARVRAAMDERVARINAGVTDPVTRLAGGMLAAVAMTLEQPKAVGVMLRSLEAETVHDLQLNRPLAADVAAVVASGAARPEAAGSGVRYWLGLCQVLMSSVLEGEDDPASAATALREMLVLGLTGLGVADARADEIAAELTARLETRRVEAS
jgi:AcrR family transcriptional regulator